MNWKFLRNLARPVFPRVTPGLAMAIPGFPDIPPLQLKMDHCFNEGGKLPVQEKPFPSFGSAKNGSAGAAGNPLPIEALYRKYGPSLFWVCLRYTRSHEDAEDMVHQVFMKVQKHLAEFRGDSSIYTWMYRIAVNECIQMFRKRQTDKEGRAHPWFTVESSTSPEKSLDAKLMLEKICGNSDPRTMEILFLLHMEGLSQEEVASTLKISRSTVNRKIADFKAKLDRFR